MTNPGRTIAVHQLPGTIATYLVAHRSRDLDASLAHFTPDATVTDEGKTYRGHSQIHGWLRRSGSEFTYTIELTGAEKIDEDHYTATHHLEGDFPGGVVDLWFRFALRDGRISALVIEP